VKQGTTGRTDSENSAQDGNKNSEAVPRSRLLIFNQQPWQTQTI